MVTNMCIFNNFVNNYVLNIMVLSNILSDCCLGKDDIIYIYAKYFPAASDVTPHLACIHSVICKTDARDIFVSSVKKVLLFKSVCNIIKLSSNK